MAVANDIHGVDDLQTTRHEEMEPALAWLKKSDGVTKNRGKQNATQPPLVVIDSSAASNEDTADGNVHSFSAADKLTVCGLSKVDEEFPTQLEDGQHPSRWVTLMRWLVMVIIFLGFLTCLVASKLSALSIGNHMSGYRNFSRHDHHSNNSKINLQQNPVEHLTVRFRNRLPVLESGDLMTSSTVYGMESAFLWILLVLLVPNVTTFFLSLWGGACRHDRPWPSWSAILWGLLSSVLEACGLTVFTLEVMSNSPSLIVVWVMNSVFLMPLLIHLLQSFRGHYRGTKRWQMVLLGLGFCFEIAGIVLAILVVVNYDKDHKTVDHEGDKVIHIVRHVLEITLPLLLISIAWSPSVQKRVLTPRLDQLEELWKAKRSRRDQEMPRIHKVIAAHPEFSARWKNSLIMCLTKMILIPAVGFLYVYITRLIDFRSLHSGFLNLTPSHPMFTDFMVNIFSSMVGTVVGIMACMMCMQKLAFALPLVLSTPVSFAFVLIEDWCLPLPWKPADADCPESRYMLRHLLWFIIPASLSLLFAQIFSTAVFIFKTQTIVMQKSSHLFWLPGYNGIFMEQFLMLGRKNIQTNANQSEDHIERARNSHVIICTTMYREAEHEMEQLLRSIKSINRAKQFEDRRFESHIFFDNGTRDTRLTEFALQLVCVVKRTLDVESSDCTKVLMPYGMRLTWKLPTVVDGKQGMVLVIHLKDNLKVKSKKRWSQVMYMSYVIDYFLKEEPTATLDNTFILTTDADVKFAPESCEALLDLMMRDDNVGAVCSRTFPLGSGPVYWYQIFDYAIGHWLQKASNHVLGSVLCCPGCFSVYRVEAVKDILPIYGSHVEKASEFLTKDMGEDRWLCTLMVQSGWRLEYCAAASNSTYCPEEFDEFFKQRRRWIPSTLANLALLLQEWKIVSHFNTNISFVFMLYQALLLFSGLINPSVSILVIVGGLQYSWSVNPAVSTILLVLITVGYTFVCLYCSQDTQLMVAKVMTCFFAMVMAAVFIGTIAQIVEDESPAKPSLFSTTPAPTTTHAIASTSKRLLWQNELQGTLTATPKPDGGCTKGIWLPLSVSTFYLSGLVGVFLITALLHLSEMYCLLHGIWYLFCLPAGNLLLMIYSICNITDRSWGTREEKKVTVFDASDSWSDSLKKIFKQVFFCFKYDEDESKVSTGSKATQTGPVETETGDGVGDGEELSSPGVQLSAAENKNIKTLGKSFRQRSDTERQFQFSDLSIISTPLSVREWLPPNLKDLYSDAFEMNGYDDTSFVAGMTDADLRELGVKQRGHRNALMQAIRLLPEVEIQPCVPKSITKWLQEIGLSMYQKQFLQSHIVSPSNMEVLKSMSAEDIKKELGITKRGHLKRLIIAITRLRYPSQTETERAETRNELEVLRTFNLKLVNQSEFEFWEKLRQEKLLPDSGAFAHDADLKARLEELRNSTLLVFAIANVIWLILILTLATKSESLNVLCTNPLGLLFLVIFGSLIFVQFFCMIVHRLSTWMHMVARAPDRCGQPNNSSWAFKDADFRKTEEDAGDVAAMMEREELNKRFRERYLERVNRRHMSTDTDRRPLLSPTSPASFSRQPASNNYSNGDLL